MTQREEIAIRLGVDSRSAVTNLERFQTKMTAIGKDIGKSFTKGVGRIADAFGMVNLISQARELGKEFKRLQDARDFEGIQKQFGELTGTEMEALENVGGNLEKFWTKVKVTTLGGVQSVMNVFATMLHERKGLSAAIDSVVDDDIAKMKEFADAIEAARLEKIWSAEKDAILRFQSLQKQIEFKRADNEGRIKLLKAEIAEMNALMGQATTPEAKYGYAGNILTAEDSLKDLEKQQYIDNSMRDLQNAHAFIDAQPERALPETTAEYLARGQQSAADRYKAARGMDGSPPNPQPIKVVIVGVDTK